LPHPCSRPCPLSLHNETSQCVVTPNIQIVSIHDTSFFEVTAQSMRLPSIIIQRIQRIRSQSTSAPAATASQTQMAVSRAPKASESSQKPLNPEPVTSTNPKEQHSPLPKPTYFKITQHRSAIGLPKRYKDTLLALGLRRRLQTVFLRHSAPAAGKILRVKELVKVENVTRSEVKTKRQMREERKAVRGYYVKQRFANSGVGPSTSWMDGL